MKRRVVISSLSVLLVALVAFAGVYFFLRSGFVARQVAIKMQAIYGGAVHVWRVDVGFRSTTIEGVELFEAGSDGKDDAPWLKIEAVTAEIPVWNLICGEMPKRIRVNGASVLIRFDRTGDLLTRFPGHEIQRSQSIPSIPWNSIPETWIEGSDVTVRKLGYGDLYVKNAAARVRNEVNKLVLEGSGFSAELGKLDLQGSVPHNTMVATVSVKSEGKGHVTQSFVDRLPFVPSLVGQEFQIVEGDTVGDVSVSYDLVKKSLHYRVDVVAENTNLSIPGLDVTAHQGSGKLTIEDHVVRLREVKGHAFGGVIHAEADVVFRGAISKLSFPRVAVEDLDISQLPTGWNVPEVVRKSMTNGRVFGSASIEMTLGAEKVKPASAATLVARLAPEFVSAHWLAQAAVAASFPIHEPGIVSHGSGEVRDPTGQNEPIEFDWHLAPSQVATNSGAGSSPLDKVSAILINLVTLTSQPIAQKAKEAAKEPGNYVDVNFNLKKASLAELIKNEDLKLPFPVDGKASFQIKASIPADRIGDLKAYKAKGSAHITQLTVAGLKLNELQADIRFADGVLDVELLKSAIIADGNKQSAAGTLAGNARLQLAPLGDIRADLTVDRIPIAKLANLPPDQVQGMFSASMAVRGRADKLQGATGLQVEGRINLDGLALYGVQVGQFTSSVRLKEGALTFPDLQVEVEGARFSAPVSLRFNADRSFQADIDIRDWSLASLQNLAGKRGFSIPPLTGALSSKIIVAGKVDLKRESASGDVRLENLKFSAFESKDSRFQWEIDSKKLVVKDVHLAIYKGLVAGSALIPFDAKSAGKIDLTLQGLNVNQLASDLHIPLTVEGELSGSLQGMLSAAEGGKPRRATLQADLRAPRIRVQNIVTDHIVGQLAYQNGKADYKLTGNTLGGTFEMEGQLPGDPRPKDMKKEPDRTGRLQIKNVRLSRLFDALGAGTGRDLTGIFNLEVRYSHDTPDRFPAGDGKVRVTNLRWHETILADDLQGEILLSDGQIRVRNFRGDFAQGTIAAHINYSLRDPERSTFRIDLERVESGRILAPWFGKKVEGALQARVRGSLGSAWRGTADCEFTQAKVYGLDVASWRIPATWNFAPRQNRGEVEIRETTGQLSHGKATGKFTLAWDQRARVDGFLRLEDVELRELLRQTAFSSELGGGKASARIDFKGTNVRSLNDVGATVVATFNQSQALQLPVFSQLAPLLGVGSSTTFQKGNFRGRLDGGILRIEQFTLQGNTLQVFVDGSVTVEQRVNLHVVAKTTNVGWPAIQLGPISLRIPFAGPVPLIAIEQASIILANHLVNLDVTGTVTNPVIRPHTVALLSQETIRFFLLQSNLPISLNP